jgi:cysteine desulfurase/selenocysteine lyase
MCDPEVIESSSALFKDLRIDFPILSRLVHDKPLIYFDSAATTQKPSCVLLAMNEYYQQNNANIHRGVHSLSMIATKAYEKARRKVKTFINANEEHEIIFTRGATESINLVASCLGRSF